ncbi:hypothetical protein B0H13DRAFT_1879884 [Mycena leptocephala]|nr:hypothetical protein B0H13DRAFT_1879884 [Mycena leptocephala]
MTDNSPPDTTDNSPPDTSDALPPDTSPSDDSRHTWSLIRTNKKNRQDKELAKRSDEIFKYLQDTCFPQVAKWEASKDPKDKRTRKYYIESEIYPEVDKKFDISRPNGFKIQDFLDTIVQSHKNWIRVAKDKGQVPVPAPVGDDADEPAVPVRKGPAPRIRRKTAKDMFRLENKKDIDRQAKQENENAERSLRDGLAVKSFTRILEERWARCSETEIKRLQGLADAENERKKMTTEESLARNQDYLSNHAFDALQRLIGFGPNQAGKCCFLVRSACLQPDGTIKFRRVSVHDGKQKDDFTPVADGEATAFKAWATSRLSAGDDLHLTPLDMDGLLSLPAEEPLDLDTELKLTAPPAEAPADTKSTDDNTNSEDFSPGLVKGVALASAESTASGSSTPPNAPPAPPLDTQAPSELRATSVDMFLDPDAPLSPGEHIVLDEFGIDDDEGSLPPPPPPTPPVAGESRSAPPPPPTPPVTHEGGLAPPQPPTPTPAVAGEGRLAPPPPPTGEGGLAPPLRPTATPPVGQGRLAPPPPLTLVSGEGAPASSHAPALPAAAARKRGRPPKRVLPTVPVADEDTPSAPAPKKRGRPPKKSGRWGRRRRRRRAGRRRGSEEITSRSFGTGWGGERMRIATCIWGTPARACGVCAKISFGSFPNDNPTDDPVENNPTDDLVENNPTDDLVENNPTDNLG